MKAPFASTLLLLSLAGSRAVLFKKGGEGGPTDEDSCELVSSRGLLFSCDVHPIAQQSDTGILMHADAGTFVASATTSLGSLGMAHYPVDIAKHSNGVVVYVVTTALPAFIHQVLPGIKQKFKLVTGDADQSPIEVLGRAGFESLADNEHLIKWFAQNAAHGGSHAKLVHIPIGLDYHTLKVQATAWGPMATPKAQEAMLMDKARSAPVFENRISKGYFVGFVRSPERAQAISAMRTSHFADVKPPTPNRSAFWEECGNYRFVMSPVGNGWDCHRTWEALAMGSIPVVSDRLHELYDNNEINVVQLSDVEWSQLDSQAVQQKIEDAVARHKDGMPKALYLKFWLDMIRA